MIRSTEKIRVNVGKSGSESYKVYARIERMSKGNSNSVDYFEEVKTLDCSGRYFHFDVNNNIVYDGTFNVYLTKEQYDLYYDKLSGTVNKKDIELQMLYYVVIDQMISEYEGLLTSANLEIFYGTKLK